MTRVIMFILWLPEVLRIATLSLWDASGKFQMKLKTLETTIHISQTDD